MIESPRRERDNPEEKNPSKSPPPDLNRREFLTVLGSGAVFGAIGAEVLSGLKSNPPLLSREILKGLQSGEEATKNVALQLIRVYTESFKSEQINCQQLEEYLEELQATNSDKHELLKLLEFAIAFSKEQQEIYHRAALELADAVESSERQPKLNLQSPSPPNARTTKT